MMAMQDMFILKIHCGDNIRRVVLPRGNTCLLFSDLQKKTRQLHRLPADAPLFITYFDVEGDEVTLAGDMDLADALLSQKLNPLHVFVQVVPLGPSGGGGGSKWTYNEGNNFPLYCANTHTQLSDRGKEDVKEGEEEEEEQNMFAFGAHPCPHEWSVPVEEGKEGEKEEEEWEEGGRMWREHETEEPDVPLFAGASGGPSIKRKAEAALPSDAAMDAPTPAPPSPMLEDMSVGADPVEQPAKWQQGNQQGDHQMAGAEQEQEQGEQREEGEGPCCMCYCGVPPSFDLGRPPGHWGKKVQLRHRRGLSSKNGTEEKPSEEVAPTRPH
eukprot:jgi/Mesen1/7460/ME000389S06792